ncbi:MULTISPECIES: TlpA family protein disulfide reductase [Paenibacillus]|uniref:Alkyl hydroperoxide reductase n=1 Tax=Paenibacillus naphthalenovorans TaxID=162209 RepID=A0A0U2M1N7_9BACL|nr:MULTISPECIES: TlpA disulfide reductase family protein [Paenibacillus]ALS21024.1 alkyl hydroperoxide reductase [Paenibacillus naphthalenovorans]GCL71059.1 TlpA family protein disulfide reductase [Paenibacillus naphthalenovorans]SDI61850.1 Thiol-disulfide isomerase or thioredoxin [Paenibacillus naphthalenovorans]
MKKNAILLLVALLLAGIAFYQHVRGPESSTQAASAMNRLAVGQPVPQIILQGLDGSDYRLGGARDKPLVINFWASWCRPCHEEAPDLSQVYERYQGKIDLYAVNVTKDDSINLVQSFVQQYRYTFPVLLDSKGEAASAYRILFVPTSFLIDRQGRLLEVIHVLPKEELDKKIRRLVESAA